MESRPSPIHVIENPLDIWEEVIRKPIGEEAVHFCDLSDVVRKYINWTRLLPRVVPFYGNLLIKHFNATIWICILYLAVKANDSPNVVRVLAALGTSFDCASKQEMKTVLGVGVSSSRIIYAHPAKNAIHLRYAIENGVNTMTFDNADELYKIKTIASEAK